MDRHQPWFIHLRLLRFSEWLTHINVLYMYDKSQQKILNGMEGRGPLSYFGLSLRTDYHRPEE